MGRGSRIALLAGALLATTALPAVAEPAFNRISTFEVVDNLPKDADRSKATVAEIVKATEDGKMLVYTDSPGERIGLVDISDPEAPKAAGVVALGGEPTSTVVGRGKALVGVVTSKTKTQPSGHLSVVDLATKAVTATCDLGGQPDSLALSDDGRFLAIAIENERDEEVNDGNLPQLPGGNLTIFSMGTDGAPDCASKKVVELTGLAAIAPEDPEPEFVDINDRNEAVVTLQENNHIAIIDLATGKVLSDFPAGNVDLKNVDTKSDGVIAPIESIKGVAREPDAVHWLDNDRFVTANEGDWKGGSRGFTVFKRDGTVEYDSAETLEHLAMRLGHYPEKRSKAKGVEPEGVEAATFDGQKLIFIGTERASLIGVYEDMGDGKAPVFLQALAGGAAPEGLLAIPSRGLFVSASEADRREEGGMGSVVTIYQRSGEPAAYPTIASVNGPDGTPIPWGAISGAAADPTVPGRLYAVTDSAYAQARILTIDTTKKPAAIVSAVTVMRDGKPAEHLDLEGIAIRPQGGFWLASEGNPERKKAPTQNLLIAVDDKGEIRQEIALPEDVAQQATRFGFEGVTVTGKGDDELVWLAQQLPWKNDPKNTTKLIAYSPTKQTWGAVRYPLEQSERGWVGLSEITAVGDKGVIVLERDNGVGSKAAVKVLMFVPSFELKPVPLDSANMPVVRKTLVHDLLPDLKATHGYVLEKVESFAVDSKGDAFVITDNDGVDGSSGETMLIRLGEIHHIVN